MEQSLQQSQSQKAVEAIEMDIMSTDEEADDMLTFFDGETE